MLETTGSFKVHALCQVILFRIYATAAVFNDQFSIQFMSPSGRRMPITTTTNTSDSGLGVTWRDIRVEVARASKLQCGLCHKKGANAGCEVCHRRYHVPCGTKRNATFIYNREKSYSICWSCSAEGTFVPCVVWPSDDQANQNNAEMADNLDAASAEETGPSGNVSETDSPPTAEMADGMLRNCESRIYRSICLFGFLFFSIFLIDESQAEPDMDNESNVMAGEAPIEPSDAAADEELVNLSADMANLSLPTENEDAEKASWKVEWLEEVEGEATVDGDLIEMKIEVKAEIADEPIDLTTDVDPDVEFVGYL